MSKNKRRKYTDRQAIAAALNVPKSTIERLRKTHIAGEWDPTDNKLFRCNADPEVESKAWNVYCVTDDGEPPANDYGWECIERYGILKGWNYTVWCFSDDPHSIKEENEDEKPDHFDGPPRDSTPDGIMLPPDAEAWREMIEQSHLPSLAEPFAYYAIQQMHNATESEDSEPVIFDKREVAALINSFNDFTRPVDTTPENLEWNKKRIDLAILTCETYRKRVESSV